MTVGTLLSRAATIAPALAILLYASAARATQPLEDFLRGAENTAFDAREQAATARQKDAEADAALGRLLPSLTARGLYTRNQFEVAATLPQGRAVIQPLNQLDAFFVLDVPIVDLASYYRLRSGRAAARVAETQRDVTRVEVSRGVARGYYQFVGASALARAARESIKVAEANLRNVELKSSAGVATTFDVERARANAERARQDLADAELAVSLAGRALETLSGVSPQPSNDFPQDDLHAEAPLDRWMSAAGESPQDRAAREASSAATEGKKSATAALLPTLSGSAQQRFTNATGFAGREAIYQLQLVLQWRLDYGTYATSQAQAASRDVQKVREEKVRRAVSDSVFEAYRRVEAGVVKARSSRAQSSAAARAAELASDRYDAGAATQLDVVQAQREAFLADANKIQADADLAFARASLRLAAGSPPSRRNP